MKVPVSSAAEKLTFHEFTATYQRRVDHVKKSRARPPAASDGTGPGACRARRVVVTRGSAYGPKYVAMLEYTSAKRE